MELQSSLLTLLLALTWGPPMPFYLPGPDTQETLALPVNQGLLLIGHCWKCVGKTLVFYLSA